MSETLNVFFYEKHAGYIFKDKKNLSFIYNQDYINDKTNPPISASMPLSETKFSNEITEAFFQGLLPDERVKIKIAKILHTSEKNTFGLLKELAADCAGAILVLPQMLTPKSKNQQVYKEIDKTKALEILLSLSRRPLYIGENDFRVSGAGAQDKLVASYFSDSLYLPLHGSPSTHIIKPNIEGFTDTTFNEFFCMQLAELVGLRVPKTAIKKFNSIPFYIVERYDRLYKNKQWQRIHQEDFCQALSILPEKKYEGDGGPSFKDCFLLLDSLGISAKDKIAFLDLIIYNYLIGNGDAHAKNFSILYYDNTPSFAPCYDLMCTAILNDYYPKCKMAMKLNQNDYTMSKVKRSDFANIADISGFRRDFVLQRLDKICKNILPLSINLAKDLHLETNTNSQVYEKINNIIKIHVSKVSCSSTL